MDFDLQLFEQLNEEYRDRPLVPIAPSLTSEGRLDRARALLERITRDVEVADKRVLEIGTAKGHLSAALVREGGAREAIGVDVVASEEWERSIATGVRYDRVDLARQRRYPDSSFDLVISNAVLEHVDRPLRMLESISRLLSPTGEAWLKFNLHRGPKASHRYREVFFPWPHLLFEPTVCDAFYRKHHDRRATFAWVNHLTAAEYVEVCREVGLHVDALSRSTTPIDVPFYARFEGKLGRYPALDLETDFLTLKLSKRTSSEAVAAGLNYVDRQRSLDDQLDPLPADSESTATSANEVATR